MLKIQNIPCLKNLVLKYRKDIVKKIQKHCVKNLVFKKF